VYFEESVVIWGWWWEVIHVCYFRFLLCVVCGCFFVSAMVWLFSCRMILSALSVVSWFSSLILMVYWYFLVFGFRDRVMIMVVMLLTPFIILGWGICLFCLSVQKFPPFLLNFFDIVCFGDDVIFAEF